MIALNSIAPSRTAAPAEQPDFYVGAAHLLHAALGDPLAQDIRTLANTNALIGAGFPATNGRSREHRPATRQQQPGGLPRAGPARALHLHRARGPRGDRRDRQARLPQALRAPLEGRRARSVAAGEDPRRGRRRDARGALLSSYLFFAGEFAEELIQLGQADAQRWIDEHPAGLWQLNPLPAWNPAPNDDTGALIARRASRGSLARAPCLDRTDCGPARFVVREAGMLERGTCTRLSSSLDRSRSPTEVVVRRRITRWRPSRVNLETDVPLTRDGVLVALDLGTALTSPAASRLASERPLDDGLQIRRPRDHKSRTSGGGSLTTSQYAPM